MSYGYYAFHGGKMKSRTGFEFAASCLILNIFLLFVSFDSALAQKLTASANATATASFRVRVAVAVPDSGVSSVKGIQYAEISSDDLHSLFAPTELLDKQGNAPSYRGNTGKELAIPGRAIKGKKLIVFVNN